MDFCMAIFKFFVFLSNFIFCLGGMAITGVGTFIAVETESFLDYFGNSKIALAVNISPYIVIFVGLLVTIISFLGCCGSCTDNKCMMYSFGTLMALILISEICLAITLFMYKELIYHALSDAMDKGFANFKSGCGANQLEKAIGLNISGCLTVIEQFVEQNRVLFIVGGIAVMLEQLIISIGSVCLARNMVSEED